MKTNYKASFAKVFDEKRRCLIRKYSTNPDLLERISYSLKDKRSFRLLAESARNKYVTKGPSNLAWRSPKRMLILPS